MKSILDIYKIGYGPSSSHTIGPRKAAETFAKHIEEIGAAGARMTLFGSLGATGKGHLTDLAVIAGLKSVRDIPVEIVWKGDVVPEFHTNGMLYESLDASGQVIDAWKVYSIGGGNLSEGPEHDAVLSGEGLLRGLLPASELPREVYPHSCLTEVREYVEKNGMHFWEYVEQFEGPGVWDYLGKIWDKMQESVKAGLENDSVLPGGLHMRSKAKQYFARAAMLKDSLRSRALVSAYTLAVSEQNARGGEVVTAPTCGSCGVVPGVLFFMSSRHDYRREDILKALATAGIFGNVIRTNASVSGAEVGCQGEVGSACVMAAVAVNQLFGGDARQIEAAGEMAMEHNLGLTCDPVCGLVQIPCIERNVVAALRALDVSLYAQLGDGKHLVSFDQVVHTMLQTGHDIPSPYKETALGGLATEDLI